MEENTYLGRERVGKLLLKFAVPSTLALIISCLYNIVDQIFVGNGVGYLGNAATGIIFPITVVGWGASVLFGDGMATFLSLSQGQGNTSGAGKSVANSILGSFFSGVVIIAVYYALGDSLLYALGATEATIGSQIYTRYIQELKHAVSIYGKACPLFVPLVEEGLLEDPVTDEIARRYLTELIDIDIDTLILGCTHYPLIRTTLGKIMGEQVRLVNPAYETARELKILLQEQELENNENPGLGQDRYRFFVSDAAEKFKRFANSIIKYGILSAKTVNIEEY